MWMLRFGSLKLLFGNLCWVHCSILKYPSLYVCKYVLKYVCTAMRFVMLWGIKLKLGAGYWMGPRGLRAYFRSDLTKGQRSSCFKRSSCFTNVLWPPNLVGRTPDQREVQCWGQRSYNGQPGSTGVITQECPMATKFGRMNLWPKYSAMLGSKVIWGQMEVKWRSNCLEMPYSHQKWLMPL